MRVLSAEDKIATANLYRWLDLGNGVAINGSYYNKQAWAPYPKSILNIGSPSSKSVISLPTVLHNTFTEYTTPTTPDALHSSSQAAISGRVSFKTEPVIIDSVNPNIKWQAPDEQVTASSTTGEFIINKIDTSGDFPLYTKCVFVNSSTVAFIARANVQYMLQSEQYVFIFLESPAFEYEHSNYAQYTKGSSIFKLLRLDKATLEIIEITASGFDFNISLQCYSTSWGGSLTYCIPSIVEDTPTNTILYIQGCLFNNRRVSTTTYLNAQVYHKFFNLDKTTGTISEIVPEMGVEPLVFKTPTSNTSTSGITTYTNLSLATASYMYENPIDGKKYSFSFANPAAANPTVAQPAQVYINKFNDVLFEDRAIMAVNWSISGLTDFPRFDIKWTYSNKASTSTNTEYLPRYSYDFFVTEVNDTPYLNFLFKTRDPNEQCAIYTFTIDFENNELTWVATSPINLTYCLDMLKMDDARHGGKNTTVLIEHLNESSLMKFNPTTLNWDIININHSAAYTRGLDYNGDLVQHYKNDEIHLDSITDPISINFEFDETVYYYNGVVIESNVNVDAYNYENERIVTNVKLNLTGPAVWTDTNNSVTIVTLSDLNTTAVPFKTTGKEGTISVFAELVE